MKKVIDSQKVKEPKKAVKAEPEPEVTPTIVKHPHAAKTLDDLGISDQQMIFAQYVAEGRPRVEAYRLAGYSDVGHSAYASTSRSMRDDKVSRYIRHLRNERQA